MPNIKITETVLCGAQRMLNKQKMPLEDILPSLGLIDAANYHSCEVLNRNSYHASIKIFNEDPWKRLQALAKSLPNTSMQATFAGRYLLGDRLFPDDVVEYFIQRVVANGIKILRIFDPLNDIENITVPIKLARQQGVHVQAGVLYTTSSIHSTGTFLNYIKKLEDLGADSICLIDGSELLNPYATYSLIAAIKKEVQIPIQFSTPNSTGIGYMNVIKAAEAGVDMLDTAISPFADGVSYPATESITTAFEGSPYSTGLSRNSLYKIEEFFSKLQDKYLCSGELLVGKMLINPYAIKTKLPNDALEYIFRKVDKQATEKLEAIFEEISKIRELAGDPPLAFPIYVGIVDQAIINVDSGAEFSSVNEGFGNILKGKYGNTPSSIDPLFKENVLKSSDVYGSKVLEPELEKFRTELPEKFNEQVEDVLTLAQFPEVAPEYFETRSNRLYNVDGKHSDKLTQVHPI